MATWKVTQLERNASDGVATKATWRIEIVQGSVNEFTVGEAVLGPKSRPFIAFDSLTEADVVGWLKTMPELLAVEADVTNRAIAAQVPTTVLGLPAAFSSVSSVTADPDPDPETPVVETP